MIYLDHNATTPLAPEAREAMLPYLDGLFGNPSSQHQSGQAARAAVEEARDRVAELLRAPPESVVFVSGGTEADNLALRGVMRAARGGDHLLVSAVEHPAVLRTAEALAEEGFRVEVVPVDAYGRVDPDEVERRLRAETRLASVMLANNEVGTIQPVEEVGRRLRRRGVLFHVDAVQGLAYLPAELERLGADLVTISAHKIRGPKGIGALMVRPGVELRPQMTGGAQELRRRAGTPSPALCAGFGAAAARLRPAEDAPRIGALRDRLEQGVRSRVDGTTVLAPGTERIPNTSCMLFEGIRAEALVVALDLEGVAVSWGAACASGVARPSHVLAAMRIPPERARGAVRFSLGETTTREEIDRTIDLVAALVPRLRTGRDAAPVGRA